jgi:para-aminobenzoate synthetase component I
LDKKENLRELLNKKGSKKEPFLFLLSYDLQSFYIENLENKNIKYELNSFENSFKDDYFFEKFPISFKEYKNKFEKIIEEIEAGNSYLLNLTSKTKINTNLSLDEIYENSNALLKLRVKNDKDNFVCFSPEKFIEIFDNKVYTYPMKGTINANIKNAKELLLNSEKELSEHTMAVDLLRNDLGKISKNIKVEDFRFVEEIQLKEKSLYQTSSKISGNLEEIWQETLGDILLNLLPAGSITGTPKKSTIEILKKIEEYDRGFYTGIFGIFDGNSLQSFVLIRFIEEINGELFFKSGGGITLLSDINLEYEELINKVYLPF